MDKNYKELKNYQIAPQIYQPALQNVNPQIFYFLNRFKFGKIL